MHMYICIYIRIYIYKYVIYTHMHMYICIYINMYIYIYACVYMYIYRRIHQAWLGLPQHGQAWPGLAWPAPANILSKPKKNKGSEEPEPQHALKLM